MQQRENSKGTCREGCPFTNCSQEEDSYECFGYLR